MARICIDGFNLALPTGAGIATYARNLNAAQAALGHETQILVSADAGPGESRPSNPMSEADSQPKSRLAHSAAVVRRLIPRLRPVAGEVVMDGDVIGAQSAARFPRADRTWASRDIFHSANRAHAAYRRLTPLRLGGRIETDLMHWTCPLPLYEPRIANVYTLHDLIPLRLPSTTLDNKRAYFDMCRRIAARAERIFTVSEDSKRDIVRLLGVAEARVVNTYQAVDLPPACSQRPEDEITAELHDRFGLESRGYFLFFGAMEPKKNLARVVEAYLASGVTTPLVIVGSGWLSGKQKPRNDHGAVAANLITEDRISGSERIHRYEYLPLESLITLIQGARATLFPSLYEGFGLPVLESMLLGAPVLASTAGALPEVAGDAALLVDPYDIGAIRDGIRSLDADADLRAELAERGRRQAAKFSPERYRERLRDAYASLL